MKVSGLIYVLLTLLASVLSAASLPAETLEQLIARADAARPEERPGLYAEIAERKLKTADQFYSAGNPEAARQTLDDVITYSDKASLTATETGKKLKAVEIALRKMSARLQNIKRTVDFDDEAPVQAAVDHLESLRTKLLSRMFGKDNK